MLHGFRINEQKGIGNWVNQRIGRAIAETLLKEGAEVIINGRSEKSVSDALCEINKDIAIVKVSGIPCDFSKTEEIENLIRVTGKIDILINNVGIFEPKEFLDIPDADWQRFFDLNVMSGVRLSRAFIPHMLKQDWGRIIFISSESGINIPEEMVH